MTRSPFASAGPGVVAMLAYAVVALIWVVAGGSLPGGRWLAVHLFTLGVLTNAVLTFSQHFAHTVTRSPGDVLLWPVIVLNVGVLATLVAMPAGLPWLLAAGAVGVTVAVMGSYRAIRRARLASVGARFVWIARTYERAHGAFLHGAILGALLGTGVLGGRWYGAARVAHLHVNLLGWGLLTLLATLVFFGPTMVRTRIAPGADAVASRALRHGATSLTVGVLGLVATGAPGAWAAVGRLVAVLGLAGFAAAATIVAAAVIGTTWRAGPSAPRPLLLATGWWLIATVWSDVVVVAVGSWRFLDVLGLTMMLGVLGSAMLASLVYLAPMLRTGTGERRKRLLQRRERGSTVRAVTLHVGVVAVVLAALAHAVGLPAPALARTGWVLVVVVLVHLATSVFAPIRSAQAT